jgi:hypothetical protein
MGNKTIGPIAQLSPEEFEEVKHLPKEQQAGLFVTGFIDFQVGEVVLMKVDSKEIDIPLDWFKSTGEGPEPDFDRLSIEDFGLTIKLGEQETSSHLILYYFDPAYKAASDANKMTN